MALVGRRGGLRVAAILGFMAAAAAPVRAVPPDPPLTAEQAVAAQREGLRTVVADSCRGDHEEIVVCGRSGRDPNRLPIRQERLAGDRVGLLPGEAPTGADALKATREGCRSRCGFSVDFIRVGIVLFKIGRHLADPDSDPPPPPLPSDPYSAED